ncbi:hypothetical protein uav_017 [Pseudomonas phage UAVern]|uniref:Uncharacterized protein n=1 Tax=Pseudomonas phage UAVern TaxID=2856997 RepID=A0A975UWZ5_9CAUD|nr:hypothetical protein uav_017 [Pseudomonas phage UAVern]
MTHGIYMIAPNAVGMALLLWARQATHPGHKCRVGRQNGLWYVAI